MRTKGGHHHGNEYSTMVLREVGRRELWEGIMTILATRWRDYLLVKVGVPAERGGMHRKQNENTTRLIGQSN